MSFFPTRRTVHGSGATPGYERGATDPKKDAAPGAPPMALVVSSTRVRSIFGADDFKKLTPPALDLGVAGRTRGAGVRELQGAGEIKYFYNPDKDSEARDRCIAAI